MSPARIEGRRLSKLADRLLKVGRSDEAAQVRLFVVAWYVLDDFWPGAFAAAIEARVPALLEAFPAEGPSGVPRPGPSAAFWGAWDRAALAVDGSLLGALGVVCKREPSHPGPVVPMREGSYLCRACSRASVAPGGRGTSS